MQFNALQPYEQALLTREPLRLHREDGRAMFLDIERWLRPADAADHTVLARAVAPALDVGCGPGRIVAALAERRVLCLGIDIAETAVRLTRARGLNVLRRDVFDHVPGEGRWSTVLLLDGNIGIGGDPLQLLKRIHALLAPTGIALIETDRHADTDEQVRLRFAHAGEPIGPWFRWAHVGEQALRRYAPAVGLTTQESWRVEARSFVAVSHATTRTRPTATDR